MIAKKLNNHNNQIKIDKVLKVNINTNPHQEKTYN